MNSKTPILYIDDEPINLMLFEVIFGSKYELYLAESGLEGLEKLRSHPHICAVLSDMSMPELSGIEFIKQARLEYPNISYYILTGFNITEELADALKEGIVEKFLYKPFNLLEIEEAIAQTSKKTIIS